MQAHCTAKQLQFQGFGARRVVAGFDGGRITSDGGLLLLREAAVRSGLLRRFAECFEDHRDPRRIEHTVEELVSQRVLGIACGYEDLNDHETLRDDALLALACGKTDVCGESRARERDRGRALAGKSTLNRLELTPAEDAAKTRYKKIAYRADAIERLFVDVILDSHSEAPDHIVIDLDATDDPLHGKQEHRFFHGYYGDYCYLPLYIFAGDHLLAAKLRPSNIDASAGAKEEIERIVGQIRARWPAVRIVIRGDSGFAREEIMAWCEANAVDFVFGLARNARLQRELETEQSEAKRICEETGTPARLYKDFRYRTLDSWSRERRVVGKAEQLPGKANPRFVVTSVSPEEADGPLVYEDLYAPRGDMENRIKEQQLGLFADRTSTATMRANQLRLWFSSVAYVLVNQLRRVGLRGTDHARAQMGTIRMRLLKIGGLIKLSARRVYLALSSAYPLRRLFQTVLLNLQRLHPLRT